MQSSNRCHLGKPKYIFSYLNKYNLESKQIRYVNWRNAIFNFNKYNLQFEKASLHFSCNRAIDAISANPIARQGPKSAFRAILPVHRQSHISKLPQHLFAKFNIEKISLVLISFYQKKSGSFGFLAVNVDAKTKGSNSISSYVGFHIFPHIIKKRKSMIEYSHLRC